MNVLPPNDIAMRPTCVLCLAMFALLSQVCALYGDVNITQADDQSVTVRGSVYSARIDSAGNLAELMVHGAPALAHAFGNPKLLPPAPSIHVIGNIVAVRSDELRNEWTFKDESIHLVTEGDRFEFQIDKSAKASLAANGKGGAVTKDSARGNTTVLVLANDRTILSSIRFHQIGYRWIPSQYGEGSLKPGTLLEIDLKLGGTAEAVQLLSAIDIAPTGADTKPLLEDGNQSVYGLAHFRGSKIGFESGQQNLSAEDFAIDYELTVLDHYVTGKQVVQLKQSAVAKTGAWTRTEWQLPELPPGFYYLKIAALRNGTKLSDSELTFTVDLSHYDHALTRPADFESFWKEKDARLAATPAQPQLQLVTAASNPDKFYVVALTMPGGKTTRCTLSIPASRSTDPAECRGANPSASGFPQRIEAAKAPDYKAPAHVELYFELPEAATYTRWASAEDNNLMECALIELRAIDYLASRPEVDPKRIKLVGASRTGPLVVIGAARRPGNICGVSGHVHTSAGISWTDKPYRGWGVPNWYQPTDAASVSKLAAMAAYVDPINHAPDVRCPIIFAWGVDDDLAPPQGIEVMFHRTASKWKRISRDAGGHFYSDGMKRLELALSELLKSSQPGAPDQNILKQH